MKRATTLLVLGVGLLVAIGLVTLSSAGIYTRLRPHAFSPANVVESSLTSLALRLRDRSDPVAEYVAGRLTPIGQWAVNEALGEKPDVKAVRRMLAEDFNQIINGPLIYDPVVFSQTQLDRETRELLERKPVDNDVALANRRLLEESFPGQLSRKQGVGNLKMQLFWAVAGIGLGIGAAMFDYRRLKDVSWVIWLAAVVLLALVFVPGIGRRINGSNRWLNLGFANLQPSEFAKLAVIVVVAHYAEVNRRRMGGVLRGLFLPLLLVAPLLGLIVAEIDVGTTVLLVLVTAAMLLLAGSSVRWVAGAGVAFAAGIAALIYHNPVRFKRVLAFWNLEEHKAGIGYQVWQGIVALASGGWTGAGLGDGLQKLGFVPENQTDFILSIIGEELGLVATLGMVLTYLVVVGSGLYIASHARDRFGFLLGAGISLLIGFQAFINIAVVTSLLPNKGLPLPFVSYGGSSLLTMLVGVGLLLSVSRNTEESVPEPAGIVGDRELAAT